MSTYFYQYMAYEAPIESQKFIQNYGGKPANNELGLAQQMSDIVSQFGEPALNQLALIHPDKDLLLGGNYSNFNSGGSNCGGYSNCGGCGGYSSANGQSTKADLEKIVNGNSKEKSTTELVVLGVVVVTALALIFKK
jgi:hypothetical protein